VGAAVEVPGAWLSVGPCLHGAWGGSNTNCAASARFLAAALRAVCHATALSFTRAAQGACQEQSVVNWLG